MATLIIEIPDRNLNRYFRVDEPVVRVGRALDNDLIISDPTVSPYHLSIRRNAAGTHTLYPLAEENGTRVAGRQIRDPVEITALPMIVELGRTRLRILDEAQDTPPTRMISCRNGSSCVFGHWGWAVLLFTGLIALSVIDNYLSTPRLLTWESYGSSVLFDIIVAVGLSAGMMVLNRFTSHRWDFASSLSFVSLILAASQLLEWSIPPIDYFFTSATPGFVIDLAWTMVMLPISMAWFFIRLHHGNPAASVLFVVLLLSPVAIAQLMAVSKHYGVFGGFSKIAYYSDSLYPLPARLKGTISIDEFARINSRLANPQDAPK